VDGTNRIPAVCPERIDRHNFLELDWACVTWEGDLRFANPGWGDHDFRGDQWTNIHKRENRIYLRNAYRVLLPHARQGMVIFLPAVDSNDPTRSSACYDSTFDYLTGLGIPLIWRLFSNWLRQVPSPLKTKTARKRSAPFVNSS